MKIPAATPEKDPSSAVAQLENEQNGRGEATFEDHRATTLQMKNLREEFGKNPRQTETAPLRRRMQGGASGGQAPIQLYRDLDAEEYKLDLEEGKTFSSVQDPEVKVRRNNAVNYPRKVPQANVPQPTRVKKRNFMSKLALGKKKKGIVPNSLADGIDQNYLQGPEYFVESTTANINDKAGANMRVSDDGTMAINFQAGGEAKEFYAVDGVVKRANEGLEAVESAVKLIQVQGARINLGDSNNVLTKVIPKQANSDQTTEDFAILVRDICIEMASGVMGAGGSYIHDALLNGGKTRVPMKSSSSSGDMEKLSNIRKDSRGESTEEELGINQFANPQIGEGFGTFSLPEKDKSKSIPNSGRRSWSYHFAAAVAKSLDDNDTVTLENYNRGPDVKTAMDEVIDEIKTTSRAALVNFKFSEEDLSLPEKYIQLKRYLLNVNYATAHSMFGEIKNNYRLSTKWFFQMVGSAPGQSFHDLQVASGDFTDPITLRVGKHPDA